MALYFVLDAFGLVGLALVAFDYSAVQVFFGLGMSEIHWFGLIGCHILVGLDPNSK